jgi:tRNA A-37 threonylcarbamoyl transferase component Bud32
MSTPDIITEELRAAGRSPPMPCRIALVDGRLLTLRQLLRILPGKRITGIGEIAGQTVIAKLFIDPREGKRHWQRERQGIESLLCQGLPAPRLYSAGELSGGGHYVLSEFIEGAHSFADMDTETLRATLPRLFITLGHLHAQELVHGDAHLDNFLWRDEKVFILDGDAIRKTRSRASHLDNLALLLAQLPAALLEELNNQLLAAYRQGNPHQRPTSPKIQTLVSKARQRRLRIILEKSLRNCSQFKVEKSFRRFVAMSRNEADLLAPIVADPDRWLREGQIIKAGRTATLAMITHAGRRLVIKRYNIKDAWHALSRCWRPSRAWHAWLAAHRLLFFGISTPRPLALIERRLGPFRREAWLITEYCEGGNIADFFAAHGDSSPPTAALHAARQLFHRLYAERIIHGDLKATNLLWHDGQIVLIDLDAMRQYGCPTGFQHAWRKERRRFLRNWRDIPPLYDMLDAALPPDDRA